MSRTRVVKRREISGPSKKVEKKVEGKRASLRKQISKPTLDGEDKEAAQAAKASWVARLLEKNRGITETIKKEAVDTPHYYEALAQRGELSQDWAGKLANERRKAMQRALTLLGKKVAFVAGDGSCALNAILKGVGITTSLANQKNYEVVRDSIRASLAAAAADHYPQVAARLQDGDAWLLADDILFIAKALEVKLEVTQGTRAAEHDYQFRCSDVESLNVEGGKVAISLLQYEDHCYPLFSTVEPPTNPILTLAGENDIERFLEMGFWRFWQLWMETTFAEEHFQGQAFSFSSWVNEFDEVVERDPSFLDRTSVGSLYFGNLSRDGDVVSATSVNEGTQAAELAPQSTRLSRSLGQGACPGVAAAVLGSVVDAPQGVQHAVAGSGAYSQFIGMSQNEGQGDGSGAAVAALEAVIDVPQGAHRTMTGRTVTGEPAVVSLSSPISAESAAEGGGRRVSGLPDGGRSGPVGSEMMHSGWTDELRAAILGPTSFGRWCYC
jgi:hypothetical protein